jgi:hypothetical protein
MSLDETITEKLAELAQLAIRRRLCKVVLIGVGGQCKTAGQQKTGQHQHVGQATTDCT